jgi:hypothetical protein
MSAAATIRRASDSSSVPPVQETSYLSCPEGRIGYDVAGGGSPVMLCPAWLTCQAAGSEISRAASDYPRNPAAVTSPKWLWPTWL